MYHIALYTNLDIGGNSMRYKVKIINAPGGIEVMELPTSSSTKKGSIKNNDYFIAIAVERSFDGTIWFQDEKTNYWIPYQKNKKTYGKVIVNLEPELYTAMPQSGSASTNDKEVLFRNSRQVSNMQIRDGITTDHAYVPPDTYIPRFGDNLNVAKQDIPKGYKEIGNEHRIYQNSNQYPQVKGVNQKGGMPIYNYALDLSDIKLEMDKIKRDMNIPYGDIYSKTKINRLTHTQFNRYRVMYPDYERTKLISYVFFTRPDLNFYNSSLTRYSDSLLANEELHYLVSANPLTAKSLTKNFTSTHMLMPLLCNRVASFDTVDDTLEAQETGETFTGYKMKYAKSTIRSMTGGSISIKFPETYNLAITTAHQLWVGYENAVYRGLMEPKKKYVLGKILDYAVDIFYLLTDVEGVIWFWSQIYGAFPTNVNKSVFSYDEGSAITFPSVSVNYEYFLRKDWNPNTITHFNILSGMQPSIATRLTGKSNQPKQTYLADYIPALGHSGRTWAGTPFIEPFIDDDGSGEQIQRFRLRHRPSTEDV